MDVWSLTRAALRRWYLLLPALLATAFLATSAGDRVAPEYETTGAVLLVPPSYSGGPNNPYAASSGAQALSIVVNGSAVRQRLADLGMEPGYELTVTARTPIFNIRVRSADAARAIATGDAVIEALRQELLRGQREFQVPPSVMATIKVLDQPDGVSEVGKGATRVKAAVALVGAILSIALAVTFDDIMLLLRARRAARAARRKPPTTSREEHSGGRRRQHAVAIPPPPSAVPPPAPSPPAVPAQEPAQGPSAPPSAPLTARASTPTQTQTPTQTPMMAPIPTPTPVLTARPALTLTLATSASPTDEQAAEASR